MVVGSLSMSTRRAFVFAVMMTLLCGAGMRAQQAAAPPAAAAQADPFKFSIDNVLILFQVKPDKTADFESAWAAIKDKLSKTDKTDYKELGDSIKIYKVNAEGAAAPAGSPIIYVFQLNPPSKTLSYDPGKILYAPGLFERKDADEIYKKISEGLAGLNFLPLSKVGG